MSVSSEAIKTIATSASPEEFVVLVSLLAVGGDTAMCLTNNGALCGLDDADILSAVATLEERKWLTRIDGEIECTFEKPHNSSSSVSWNTLFGLFWKAYPRRVGKKACRAKFVTACKAVATDKETGAMQAGLWIIERVKMFAASEAGQNGPYVPHPSTWLGQGRYDDDDAEWDGRSSMGPTSAARSRERGPAEYNQLGEAELAEASKEAPPWDTEGDTPNDAEPASSDETGCPW